MGRFETENMRMAKSNLRRILAVFLLTFLSFGLEAARAGDGVVVALGDSMTYGKGVSRGEDYPAQLESTLRAKGYHISVVNAGVNGDTSGGMLQRLASVTPDGTRLVIL
jgi:acyl-CoA thioesterase I